MGILKRGHRSLYHYTISGVTILLSLLAAITFSNISYAAPGCSNYTHQVDCSSDLYWEGDDLIYGEDAFKPVNPDRFIKAKIEKERNGKYKFYKRGETYLVIPENHKPGDKLQGALLASIKTEDLNKQGAIAYKDNLVVHESKEARNNALKEKASSARNKIKDLKEQIIDKNRLCEALKNSPIKDEKAIKDCEATVSSLRDAMNILDKDATIAEEQQEASTPNGACNIGEGLGWAVCPASNFMALLTDGAFSFLGSLLKYETFAKDDSREKLQEQWSVMRNIANFAFVIAFLIVVYSQLTSLGVSNYNIKRMIPRLVVGAILLNLSFLICGLLVDMSNIAGSGLNSLIEKATPVSEGSGSTWGDLLPVILSGGGAAAGVAVTGSGGLLLSLAIPALITALMAIVTVIIILIARQAILTILIVISPLAFIAFLLPNTVKWFDRWRSIFISMLLMYPVIAVVFAGSKFAAAVVSLGDEGTFNNIGLSIASLAIQAIPLFIVPVVLKASGGILQRFGVLTNNKSKGVFDRARKASDERVGTFRNIQAAKWLNKAEEAKRTGNRTPRRSFWAGDIVRSKNRETALSQSEGALGYQQSKYNATQLSDRKNALRAAAGDEQMATVIQAQASNTLRKEDDKIIEAMGSNYEGLQKDDLLNRIAELIENKSSMQTHEMAALVSTAVKTTDPHDYMPILEKVREAGKSLTSRTAAAAAPSWALGAAQRTSFANGTMSSPIKDEVAANIAGGSISASVAASLNNGEYAYLTEMPTNNTEIQQKARSKVQSAANTALNTPALANQLGKNQEAVTNYANMSVK